MIEAEESAGAKNKAAPFEAVSPSAFCVPEMAVLDAFFETTILPSNTAPSSIFRVVFGASIRILPSVCEPEVRRTVFLSVLLPFSTEIAAVASLASIKPEFVNLPSSWSFTRTPIVKAPSLAEGLPT